MGYESKIIIVDRMGEDYSEIIGIFNLSNMGYNFPIKKIFENEFTSKAYIENGNESTDTDRYGDKIRYTKNIKQLVEYLEKENEKEYYRRLKPLIGMLNGLKLEDWNDLQILHYGY